MKTNNVYHEGVIQSVTNDTVNVLIISRSACSSCNSKASCTLSEMKEKIIEIETKNIVKTDYKIGDKVNVEMSLQSGNKAIFLGYGLPFLIFITTIIASNSLIKNEIITGILAITILSAYYFTLYLFRNQLKKSFSFKIN